VTLSFKTTRIRWAVVALTCAGTIARADPGVGFEGGQTLSPAAAWSAAASAAGAATASPAPVPACVYDGSLDETIRRNTFMLIPIKQGIASLTREQARAYAAKNCGLDTLPLSERMNCRILDSCSGDDCVPVYGDHGTAFLLDGGRTLLTAWHVVNESHLAALTFVQHYLEKLSDADRAKTLSLMVPSFVLVDRDEKIVYDTRDEAKAGGAQTAYARMGNPLSAFYASDGRRDGQPYGQEENIPDDFAEISLTRSLGPGFAPGVATGDPAECFVDSGFRFDGRRTTFASHAGRRADLTAMMASSGQFMKFELEPLPLPRRKIESMSTVDALVVMGYSKESALAQTKEFPQEKLRDAIATVLDFQERHMRDLQVEKNPATLFVDNPIISGESGGPLLNMNGQVVGLITNGFFYTDDAGAMRSFGGAALRLSSVPR
jgi:hypothetical protein